jgi:hypothetical protein
MKHTGITAIIAGCVGSLFTAIPAAPAALMVSVDMDTATPGIQSSISVLPGAALSVDLWATVDAAGLSSFSISSVFDTTELSLNPPGGLAPFVAPMENNALGQVYSFNAGTFGAGPVSTSFVFGSISFTAPTPVTNGANDVSVGYFNAPGLVDDAFDNAGISLAPGTVFVGGKVDVIPEPSNALIGLSCLLCLGFLRSRTRRVV